jgi:hypothetical protein
LVADEGAGGGEGDDEGDGEGELGGELGVGETWEVGLAGVVGDEEGDADEQASGPCGLDADEAGVEAEGERVGGEVGAEDFGEFLAVVEVFPAEGDADLVVGCPVEAGDGDAQEEEGVLAPSGGASSVAAEVCDGEGGEDGDAEEDAEEEVAVGCEDRGHGG